MLAVLTASREMNALGRPDLECSLKIYVEIYEKPRVVAKLREIPVPKCDLHCYSVSISDCVG